MCLVCIWLRPLTCYPAEKGHGMATSVWSAKKQNVTGIARNIGDIVC